MRTFLGRPHPWLMQALGGLIALIVMIPVAVYVSINFVFSQNQAAAPAPLAPPVAQPASSSTTGGQAAGAGAGKTYTVKMMPEGHGGHGFEFNPARLTIHVGDTVRWVDVDSTVHNIVGVGNAASIINRPVPSTAPYTVTFHKAGTYHYECQIHLPEMVAAIVVR